MYNYNNIIIYKFKSFIRSGILNLEALHFNLQIEGISG